MGICTSLLDFKKFNSSRSLDIKSTRKNELNFYSLTPIFGKLKKKFKCNIYISIKKNQKSKNLTKHVQDLCAKHPLLKKVKEDLG